VQELTGWLYSEEFATAAYRLVLFRGVCATAAWMCYKHQIRLKKLSEARSLVDEDLRLLSGLRKERKIQILYF